jgi:hypothetical protein
MENEEIWQITEHLAGMGYKITSINKEDGTLTVTLSVPLLSKKSYRVTQPDSKKTLG